MSSTKCIPRAWPISGHRGARVAALSVGLVLGGCSADVARFDFPSFSLADNGASKPGGPAPSQAIGNGASSLSDSGPAPAPSGNSVYTPPRAVRNGDIKVGSLPDVPAAAPPQSQPYAPPPSSPPPAPRGKQAASAPVAPAQPAAAAPAKGDMIEVQHGDTLYGLAKKHKVSLAELTAVNDLKSPALKPGQKLHLPAGRVAAGPGPQKPLTKPAAVAVAPAAASVPPANWNGSYTIKQGDSLFNIARQHKVQFGELQSVNGITDPRKVRPGTVIKVPGGASGFVASPAPAAIAAPAPAPMAKAPEPEPPRVISTTTVQPTVINGLQRVANAPQTVATDAEPRNEPSAAPTTKVEREQVASAAQSSSAAGAPGGKLRWPVKGKVIAGFGPRTDGTHNDGVNLAVPLGTDVHAAESGVVAYSGSELKGYGNLVLIRHDNGWVTAYAHNEQLLVKRGDKVKRGQVVAKAGKTGTVDQPQMHFELRQGSKPVDPTPFMEKL